MKFSPFFFLYLTVFVAFTAAQEGTPTGDSTLKARFFLLSGEALDKSRTEIKSSDPVATARLKELLRLADRLLIVDKFPSVTNNDYVPPGATKNDYVSFATYYWPDPSKPDGLPFIRRDGEANTEQLRVENGQDRPYLDEMVEAVKTLTLAWYLTDDPAYAKQAVRYLRCWFLDTETRMNPNLNFSQGIPGRSHGRGIGVIDTRTLPDLVEVLGLLEGSPEWTKEDREGTVRWFSDFVDWLRTSKYGIAESKEKNNHGTWYDVQLISYSLYAGRDTLAKEMLEKSKERFDTQIDKDGRQPLELARTLSFSYSTMNLRALVKLANFGERYGVDLWNYTGQNGGSVRSAYNYLLPFAEEKSSWPYKDLNFKPTVFENVLRLTGSRLAFDAEKWKRKQTTFEMEDFWR